MSNVSEKQVNYVKALCNLKGVVYDESMVHDTSVVKQTIDALKAMEDIPKEKKLIPIKDGQRSKIAELCQQLGRPEPDYDTLEGGYNNSASQMIKQLLEDIKHAVLPATDDQKELLKKMQICPWVTALFGMGLSDEEIENLDREDARHAIKISLPEYNSWLKERPTQIQMDTMFDLHSIMELPFDRKYWFQHTSETIKPWIDQFSKEANEKSWRETTLEPEDMYKIPTTDNDEMRNIERTELRTLVNALYSIAGQELEDEFFETMKFDGLKELVKEVKDFSKQDYFIDMLIEDCPALNMEEKELLYTKKFSFSDVVFKMI